MSANLGTTIKGPNAGPATMSRRPNQVMPADADAPIETGPWVQTASGRAVLLGQPVPSDTIDIRRDIAVPLGMCGRFANQLASGLLYSVAQHSLIGADYLEQRSGDVVLAQAFLVHDASQAIMGSQIAPVLLALQLELDQLRLERGELPGAGPTVAQLRRRLDEPIERFVHRAAGLPWPLSDDVRAQVVQVDLRLLMAERRQLLAPPPRPWGMRLEQLAPLPLTARIRTMSPAKAAEEWVTRFERYAAQLATQPIKPPGEQSCRRNPVGGGRGGF